MMIWQPREATFCVIFEILVEGLEDFFFNLSKNTIFFLVCNCNFTSV